MNKNVNHVILEALAPYSMKFENNNFILGELHAKALTIVNYPASVKAGWMQTITNMKNILTTIHVIPKSSANLYKQIEKSIAASTSVIYDNKSKPLAIQRAEQQLNDAQLSLKRIDVGQERLFDIVIYLIVFGKSEDELEKNVNKLQSFLAGKSMSGLVCTWEQKKAWLMASPYGEYDDNFLRTSTRNMLVSALSAALPFASSGFNDNSGQGFILGNDNAGNIILIDNWKRGNDRTNGNWVVFGTSGVGKSVFIKKLLLNEYARGTKVIIIDPEREYRNICRSLEEYGQWINCGSGGEDGIINPLQVREPCSEDEDSNESEVRIHFNVVLEPFFQLAIPSFTALDWVYLEPALIKTYEKFDIGLDDKGISRRPNDSFPILSDLYQTIEDMIKELPESQEEALTVYKSLLNRLHSLVKGVKCKLWNGHTTIDNNKAFTVMDTYNLDNASDELKAAQYYNVLTWGWTKLAQDRTEKYAFAIDEAWLIARVPKAMDFVKGLAKRIRKYSGILIFITQSLNDLLGAEVIQKGQAILDNSSFKMIMGMDGKNLKDANDLIQLTEAEQDMIAKRNQGHGLLIAGRHRMQAVVEVLPFEWDYIGESKDDKKGKKESK